MTLEPPEQNKPTISSLQQQLTHTHAQKKQLRTHQVTLHHQIRDLINHLKDVKKNIDHARQTRDDLTQKRDDLNNTVKTIIIQLKTKHQEKRNLLKKLCIRETTETLQNRIEKLDTTIETEALTLDQEKKIMSRIKDAKKKLTELHAVDNLNDDINHLTQQLENTKKQANQAHQELLAHREQQHHNVETFKHLSHQINELKKNQQSTSTTFHQLQEQLDTLNATLNEHLLQKAHHYAKKQAERQQRREHQEAKKQQLLAEKTRTVEEKLKTKKKLTTQDLLVYQVTKEEPSEPTTP